MWFGQYDSHSIPVDAYGRDNTGHQNEGDNTRENPEEEIFLVAGVERRECDKNYPAEINPTLKGDGGTPIL